MYEVNSKQIAESLYVELEADSVEDIEFMTATNVTPTMRVATYSVEIVDCEGDTVEGAVVVITADRGCRATFEAKAQTTALETLRRGIC